MADSALHITMHLVSLVISCVQRQPLLVLIPFLTIFFSHFFDYPCTTNCCLSVYSIWLILFASLVELLQTTVVAADLQRSVLHFDALHFTLQTAEFYLQFGQLPRHFLLFGVDEHFIFVRTILLAGH